MAVRKTFDIAPMIAAQATSTETANEVPQLTIFTSAGASFVVGKTAILALREACAFAVGETPAPHESQTA